MTDISGLAHQIHTLATSGLSVDEIHAVVIATDPAPSLREVSLALGLLIEVVEAEIAMGEKHSSPWRTRQ